MPIYAYKCSSCGFARDVLQKLSDPVLTVCPQCGRDSFAKQVTAAGFQLKGSGWYVTDFRDGGGKAKDKPASDGGAAGADAAAAPAAAQAASPAPAAPATPAKPAAPAASAGSSSSGGTPSADS